MDTCYQTISQLIILLLHLVIVRMSLFIFKAVVLLAVIYIANCSMPNDRSAIQSDSDYPVTVPLQVLKTLVDISDKSNKWLFTLWKNSIFLIKESLLKAKVRIKHEHSYVKLE